MAQLIKVHKELQELDRAANYHLGYYEVDFPDGALTFQLHAHLCRDSNCTCDNLAIDWHADGRIISTWFTAERQWTDAERKPQPAELSEVFQIVERLETFQERYSHLVFLRRRQVLRERGRLARDFQVRLPRELLGDGADSVRQTLGEVRPGSKGGRKLPYVIEFCGDESCYCNHLFVAVIDENKTTSFCVDPQNSWTAMEDTRDARRLLTRVEPRLSREKTFQNQLAFLRTERQLQNYHRYVTRYASASDI